MNGREARRLDRFLTQSDEHQLVSDVTFLEILHQVQLFAGRMIAEGEQNEASLSTFDGQTLLGLLDPAREQLEEYCG